jgi:hypothetical protein
VRGNQLKRWAERQVNGPTPAKGFHERDGVAPSLAIGRASEGALASGSESSGGGSVHPGHGN